MYFDLCYSVSFGRVQTYTGYTQSYIETVAFTLALFHLWETSVLYSARFFEDDLIHRAFFFSVTCAIAIGSVAVKTHTVDMRGFTSRYVVAVAAWVLWYSFTAMIVNTALTSSKPDNSQLESVPVKSPHVRKEALASTFGLTLLLGFAVTGMWFGIRAGGCNDGIRQDWRSDRECNLASVMLILGVLADKALMSVVWSAKRSWWDRLNKGYIIARYKRIITTSLGTNVLSALMQHAAEAETNISEVSYTLEGMFLGVLILDYYFDLSTRSSKQHALDHVQSWRGILWLHTHIILVLGLVLWGSSKVNTVQQEQIHYGSTTKLAIRSAALINLSLIHISEPTRPY
eukprot:TRINITY_DN14971_c0_g1_i1.p1 TRINITY_DN14971_c0_g1~~TRINITY_DN14971_c0_g1_i1.p1  ORF type:complete len:344 (+),score=70.09 TRINITY_DN14971_c0_g1_i1:1-1032(+)